MSKWPNYPAVYEINTAVWLNELRRNTNQQVTLANVPQAELERLAGFNFDALWLMGVWERITAAKQALRLRPNSVEAYNKLGDAYYYAANFNEAIPAYTQAARLRPDMGEAFYNLGMTYLEIGDRAAALTQSRLLQPLDAELYQKLIGELRR